MAILIVSCDKYSDLWDTFFDLWERYWPNCPYQVYLGSNYQACERYDIRSICIGEDLGWADNVSKMLEQIDEDYILNLGEDYFLASKVDTKRVARLLEYVVENNIDCLHLSCSHIGIETIDKSLGIQHIEPGAPYYVTASPCIWMKESLMKYLVPGYTAWDFELKNSKKVKAEGQKFATVNRSTFNIKNGVLQGKYLQSTINFLDSEGIEVNPGKRGVIIDISKKAKFNVRVTNIKMLLYIRFRLYKVKFIRDRLNI